jgi:hypothetical protein
MGCIKFYIMFFLTLGTHGFINRDQFKYHNNPKAFINENSSSRYNSPKYINKTLYHKPKGSDRAAIYKPKKRRTEPNKYPIMTFNNDPIGLVPFWWHVYGFFILSKFMGPPPPPPGLIPIENNVRRVPAVVETGLWATFICIMSLLSIFEMY